MSSTTSEARRYLNIVEKIQKEDPTGHMLLTTNEEGYLIFGGKANYLFQKKVNWEESISDPEWIQIQQHIRDKGPDNTLAEQVLSKFNAGFIEVGAVLEETTEEVYGKQSVLSYTHVVDHKEIPVLIRTVVNPIIGTVNTYVYCEKGYPIPQPVNEMLNALYRSIPNGSTGYEGWCRSIK